MSLPPLPSPSCCFLAILWLCHLLYSLVPVILLERSAAGSGLVSWDSCSDSHCSLPAATIGISERNFLKSSAAWHWMFQVTTHSGLSPRALFKVKFRQGNLNKACFFFFLMFLFWFLGQSFGNYFPLVFSLLFLPFLLKGEWKDITCCILKCLRRQ